MFCWFTLLYILASLSILVLPKQILQVSWEPADDAGRSPISYIVYATMTGMEFNISTSVEHPMTTTILTGLPQYSDGTVSVWAKNPSASSKPATSAFRMVNIVINGRHDDKRISCSIPCNTDTIYIDAVSILAGHTYNPTELNHSCCSKFVNQ